MADRPRLVNGRFVKSLCNDPNCSGILVPEGKDWRCDGLTFKHMDGPLIDCARQIYDGELYE